MPEITFAFNTSCRYFLVLFCDIKSGLIPHYDFFKLLFVLKTVSNKNLNGTTEVVGDIQHNHSEQIISSTH